MRIAPTIAIFAAFAACGGSAERPSAPPSKASSPSTATGSKEPKDDVIRPVFAGQLTVAHYATRDGMKGLVLDRTNGKFKVRLDGAKEIVELTPEEDRFSGELRGHFLVTPANVRLLYLTSSGSLRLYAGRDELSLTSDRAADPLGPATLAGAPKKPKLAYEVLLNGLAGISVRKKFPQFTSADASSIAKIAEAFKLADAGMAVHYAARDESGSASVAWTPSNIGGAGFGGGAHQTDERWDKNKPGLAKYGALIKGYSEYESQGNHLFVQTMAGYPAPLADGTPGLVWEVDSVTVVLVAFDGGRYNVDGSYSTVEKGAPIEKGAGPAARWPAPVQHALVGITEVTALAKAGAIPAKTGDDLLAIDDEWNTCAQKVWKGAKGEVDRLRTTDMNGSTRNGRGEALNEKYNELSRKQCKSSTEKLEKSLVRFIEERSKERLALFEKAKAKFGR
jgi:hypothetical protein